MNIFVYIVVAGIIFLASLPLLKKETRTQTAIIKLVLTLVVVIALVGAIYVFYVPPFYVTIVAVLLAFLLNVKWYTGKGLMILGGVVVVVGGGVYYVLKPDPGYVIDHLAKHSESSSFIFAKNGKTLVTYQAEKRRPLASTVKIILAVEYAEQIVAGKIDPQQKVSLDEPNRFYLKNTDGGAHSAWLEKMEEDNRIDRGKVTLHDIAKGMIQYSSNANTDYLLNVLGVDLVNERIKKLGLEGHEPLYPIVSSLLVPNQLKNEDMDENELESLLRNLSNKEYREIALKINKEIQ